LSLQFHPATGYFSMIPGRAFRWAGLLMLAACGTRERLTFPTENTGNDRGPISEVTHPLAQDTVVTSGDLLIIQGRAFDPDGVDTVYVNLSGINQGFAPILGGGDDTVNFAVQLSTIDQSGARLTVQVHAVDRLGDIGAIVSRHINIE
jgi:hypothetical protein